MKKEDDLIYDLIFSTKIEYSIDISDYISNIYEYEIFIKKLKSILKRAKVKLISEDVKLSSKTVIWQIKVKK